MIWKKVKKILKKYFIITGILFNLFFLWMIVGWPIIIDSWLVVVQKPIKAEAIVVVTGGTYRKNIPVDWGWQRIDTAVQLFYDGYAPKVIFTGGGAAMTSEAEAYAEAALWLGLPAEAVIIDHFGDSTAEHPKNVLKLEDIELDTPLIIVTSAFHTRRTSLCFKKQGFDNFRMVSNYRAKKALPTEVIKQKTSRFKDFKPADKVYNDVFKRLRDRTGRFFVSLREIAALAYYKIKGLI